MSYYKINDRDILYFANEEQLNQYKTNYPYNRIEKLDLNNKKTNTSKELVKNLSDLLKNTSK